MAAIEFLFAAITFHFRNMLIVILITIQATAQNAKRAKARFAETSMARTDSACENGETATYDFLVWAWSWNSWTL